MVRSGDPYPGMPLDVLEVKRIRQRPDIGGAPPRNVAIGVVSTPVVASNPARRRLVLVNDSGSVIYLARSESAVLNAGIRLNANGGAFLDEPDFSGYIYTGPWSAISAVAASNLTISEDM